MILFFVGVIELVIATFWTRVVAKSHIAMTGAITMVNIFIWFYVIRRVVEDLDDWTKIVPYVAGCSVGAMIGAIDHVKALKRLRKSFAMAFTKAGFRKTVDADEAITISPQNS